MEDSRPSTKDVLPSSSTAKRHKSSNQEAAGKISAKAKARSTSKTSKGAEKQASRRHQALEKEFSKAQKLARLETSQAEVPSFDLPLGPSASPLGIWSTEEPLLSPALWDTDWVHPIAQPSASRAQHVAPEATFTPTAAGLKLSEPVSLPTEDRLAEMIAQAIERALEARSQATRSAVVNFLPIHQPATESYHTPSSPSQSTYSGDSSSREYEADLEIPMSEEEEPPPETPSLSGLFNPSFFVPLLRKATSTAHLGPDPSTPATSVTPDSETNPNFTEPHSLPSHVPQRGPKAMGIPGLFFPSK